MVVGVIANHLDCYGLRLLFTALKILVGRFMSLGKMTGRV